MVNITRIPYDVRRDARLIDMYPHHGAPHLVTCITATSANSYLYDSLASAIAATSIMHAFGECEDSHIIGPDGVVGRDDIVDEARKILASNFDIEVAQIPTKSWSSTPNIADSVSAYAQMASKP